MKQYIVGICLLCVIACKDDKSEAPAAIENSTQHPNGVTGGAVISTDTSAMLNDSTGIKKEGLPEDHK
jgi:hypothetical protein